MIIALVFQERFFFFKLKTECLAHLAKPYLHVHALFIDVIALATVTPLNCIAVSSLLFIISTFMSSRVHFTKDLRTPTWIVNSDMGKSWYNIADTVDLCFINGHFEKKLWAELMRMPWEETRVKPQERFPQAYTRYMRYCQVWAWPITAEASACIDRKSIHGLVALGKA